ncbi:MAG: hypothetical protein OEV87_05585 [Phycisphaerae bacterium]|nr:hypothetical protein [Phycisphaerae bacterium]
MLSNLKGRCGFWTTLILLLLPLGGLLFLTQDFYLHVLWYIFSGDLFTEKWGLWMARGALDQTGIFKMYFWFAALSILYFSWLTIIRFLADRKKRSIYWTLIIGSLPIVVFLLCLLTIGSNWLRLYISNMGITQKRVIGVFFALFSYCSIIFFLIWAYRPTKEHEIKGESNR